MVRAPSEPVQLAPSEVVLWQLMAVHEQYPPLEGLVAVKAVVAVVVVFVVVVVLVVHVAMCLAVVPPSDRERRISHRVLLMQTRKGVLGTFSSGST